MNETIKNITLEKKIFFPILLTALFSAAAVLFTSPLSAWIVHRGTSALPLFTIPFFISGIVATLKIEKTKQKKRTRTLETVLLLIPWSGLIFFFLPDAFSGFSPSNPATQLLLIFTAAPLISRRTACGCTTALALPFLVIRKKNSPAENFQDWAHNYLQSHSISGAIRFVRRRVILLFLISLISSVLIHEFRQRVSSPMLLIALAALVASLIILSLLYRTEAYCKWTLDKVEIKTGYFKTWRHFSVITICAAVIFISFMPLRFEVVNRQKLWNNFIALLQDLTRSGQRVQKSDGEHKLAKIQKDTRNHLEKPEPSEPLLKKILRITLYALFFYLLAATAGLIAKRKYSYRRVPGFWKIPAALAFPLEQFLMILGAVLKLLFLIPFKKKRNHGNDALRRRLEQMFPDAENVSDEKKEEIRRIISVFLRFLRAAGQRGYPLKNGETPAEYTGRLACSIREIEKPSSSLAEGFYICRYSRDPAGKDILRKAEEDLDTCLKILENYELTE